MLKRPYNRRLIRVKQSAKCRKTTNFYAWRFVLLTFFVGFIVFVGLPIDDWFKTIFANIDKTETIRLYASDYIQKSEIGETSAWNDAQFSLGAPQVSPNGSLANFTFINSAQYKGGEGYLTLGKFAWLDSSYAEATEDKGENINDISYDYYGNASDVPTEFIVTTPDSLASSSELDLDIDDLERASTSIFIASSTEDSVASSSLKENYASSTKEITGVDEAEISTSTVEVVEKESLNSLEIISTEESTTTVEIIEVDIIEDVKVEIASSSEEFSFLNTLKNLFITPFARAQEYISKTVESIEDFGEYKSATLNFSLAGVDTAVLQAEAEIVEIIDPSEYIGEVEVEEMLASSSSLSLRGAKATKQSREASSAHLNTDVSGLSGLPRRRSAPPRNDSIFDIKKANAQNSMLENAKLAIWYSVGNGSTIDGTATTTQTNPRVWQLLDTIEAEEFSNALNGEYLSYNATWIEDWQDVNELEVKIEGLLPNDTSFTVFLDSVFVEASFVPSEELNRIKVLETWEDALELLSSQLDFKVNESGEITFKYIKQEERLWDEFTALIGITNFWSNVEIEAELIDPYGETLEELPIAMIFSEDGEFTVQLPTENNDLKPGKYKIRFTIIDRSSGEVEELTFEQDFSWGVLAINTNKSMYLPLEDAFLQMAVLDSRGHTLCDAELFMSITAPFGTKTDLNTSEGTVISNPLCGPNNVIDEPDYFAYYQTAGEGFYQIELMASTSAGHYNIRDSFEVKNELDFEVERIGPTRVYPMADYDMTIRVKANKDFAGRVIEKVPNDFIIKNEELKIKNEDGEIYSSVFTKEDGEEEKKIIFENVSLAEGDEMEIKYTMDIPNISPELFLLGPLDIIFDNNEIFSEARSWQIASDIPYVATSSNGTSNGWLTPGRAFDDSPNEYASRDILKKTGTSPESTLYLQATTNNVENMGGDINTVQIGVEGRVETTEVSVRIQPIYDGATSPINGTIYTITGANMGTTDDDQPDYQPITNDTLRPNYPAAWTWEEMQNMYIKVYGANSSNSTDRFLYIDQIYINVDYTPNNPPTGVNFNSIQKQDKSGAVDIYFQVDDADDDNDVRAKLEYSADETCEGSFSLMTIDTTDANATSSNNPDIEIDNNFPYQVGTSTGKINTSLGANNISVDWLSKSDTTNADGTYCVRLTTNDGDDDQTTPATTTVVIDNKAPTAPGNLSLASTTKDSLTVSFGASTTESHFYEYKIYYASTTPVGMKYVVSSSTDENLGAQDYNEEATTTIYNLDEDTAYYVLIVAYDEFGYKASSSEVMMTTNKAPLAHFNASSQKLTDASGIVDVSIDVGDKNNDISTAKLEYVEGADCNFSPPLDPTLDESSVSSVHGLPTINNALDYQIRDITTPATNTIQFDWPTKTDLPYASTTYCLRLTVNDGKDDQNNSATTTLMIDNFAPSAPGQLSNGGVSTSSVYLNFNASSSENNFSHYEIHYKVGTSGVTLDNDEHSDDNLLAQDYNEVANTYLDELLQDTDYVVNIWAFDIYGNRSTSTEITFKTDASISNDSLTFLNPIAPNYAIAGGTTTREYTFRAVVTDENGWNILDEVTLRLADYEDNVTPYSDLEFKWDQTSNNFSEIGSDNFSAVTLSGNSSSTCAVNTCTLDFTFTFDIDFSTTSVDYAAELYSINDSAAYDYDNYADIYQVKNLYVQQTHFRWRYDDGGE